MSSSVRGGSNDGPSFLTLLVCFPLGLIGVWQRKGTSVGVKITISVVALLLYSGALVARSRS